MRKDIFASVLFCVPLFSISACGNSDGHNNRLSDSDTNDSSVLDSDINDASALDSDVNDTDVERDADPEDESGMPMFLLAGQSNMEGSVNESLFIDLINELDIGPAGTLQSRLENILTLWYQYWNDGYAMYGYSVEMVAFEASELIRLHSAGLVDSDLMAPYADVLCSFNDAAIAPLTTNCGHPFGPELLLGHYLGTTSYTPTSLIKEAHGGTTLETDWRSPSTVAESGGTEGELYGRLQQRIQTLETNPSIIHPNCETEECRWAAFIWFQGENDCFEEVNAEAYEQNLTNFIADVRAEIGSATLPVVIVEIGAWAQSMPFGDVVAAAQQAVVAADTHAEIVVTDDLSGFYHYDPAAQLIIGERIGVVLSGLLP